MRLGIILLTSFFLSACGSSSSSPDTSSDVSSNNTPQKQALSNPGNRPNIPGTRYQSPCVDGSQNSLVWGTNAMAIYTKDFSDDDCKATAQREWAFLLNFNIQADRVLPAHGHIPEAHLLAIDVILEDAVLTLLTKEAVDKANRYHTCGIKDWTLNQGRGVIRAHCIGDGNSETIYQIARLSGNELRLGEPSEGYDGSSPETRYREFSKTVFLK